MNLFLRRTGLAFFLFSLLVGRWSVADAAGDRQTFVQEVESRLQTCEEKVGQLKATASETQRRALEDLSLDAKEIRADLLLVEEESQARWSATEKKIRMKIADLEKSVATHPEAAPSTKAE